MIFVTLGSQKFQFNRLLRKIDELIEKKIICEEVFAQIGASDYKPKYYKYIDYMDTDAFTEMTLKADIIITHGGTGAIIGAIKKEKKVLAVPRMKKYGEHVDDHQVQLLKQFSEMGIIESCFDIDKLDEVYSNVVNNTYQPYHSNTLTIIQSIECFLEKI